MKNSCIKRFNINRLVLVLVFHSFVFFSSLGADRYWVGGSGSWQDVSHWSAINGGPGGASLPTSADDVFFTANSGFGATTALKTVTMSGGTAAVVRNISFAANFAPILIGDKRLDVYGSYTLQPGMAISGWSGELHFYGTGTITSNGCDHNNEHIKFENTCGDYVVTDDFYRRGGNLITRSFVVNFASNSTTLTFNGVFYHSNRIVIDTGTVILNEGFQPHPTQYNGAHWYNDGILRCHEDSYTANFNQRGEAYFNGHNYSFASVGEIHFNGAIPLTYENSRVFDITNCTIEIRGVWDYGLRPVGTFSAGGSTVNFIASSTEFVQYDLTFHNVNVYSPSPRRNFEWNVARGGTRVQTYSGVVNFYSDVYFNTTGISGTPHHTSVFNELNFYPGYSYFAEKAENVLTVGAGAGFKFRITGKISTNNIGCDQPVFWNYLAFVMDPGVTVDVNAVHSTDIVAGGPSIPYSRGANSIAAGINAGWNPQGGISARTLVWVGPYESFGNWYESNNWRDVAIDPAAELTGPGFIGGTPACPPTQADSTIFLQGSHVFVDQPLAYVNTMEWRGGGLFSHNSALGQQQFFIFGSLYFHSDLDNQFRKPIIFRSSHPYRCIVKTANVPFVQRINFFSQDGTGSWLIQDTLIALYESPNTAVPTFVVEDGHVHTGTAACSTSPSSTIVTTRADWIKGSISLYNSNVHFVNGITGARIANLKVGDATATNAFVVNSGTSTLYFIDSLNPGGGTVASNGLNDVPKASLGNSQNYHNIVLQMPSGVAYPSFTHMIYGSACKVNNITGVPGTSVAFVNGSIASNAGGTGTNHFRKVDLPSQNKNEFARATGNTAHDIQVSNTVKFTIDSLFSGGSIDFNTNIDILANIEITAGNNYNLGTSTIPTTMTLVDASTSGPFGGCGTVQSYPAGAKFVSNGTCSEKINLNYGFLVANSSNTISIDNTTIFNNTASGAFTPITVSNSIMDGTTSGYTAAPSNPRKLRWIDPSTVAGNSGNWNDADYWEQLLPVYAAAPQCPPTRIDTAIFDNTSFSAVNQVVNMDIGTTQEVGSIYWENIPAGQNPVFSALVNTQEFHVFHSLAFHANMNMNFNGLFVFRGQPSLAFPEATILTAGKPFKTKINFLADSDTKVWSLQDELIALEMNYPTGYSPDPAGGTFNLMRGRFNTNGHDLQIKMFSSIPVVNTHYRYFDMTNSTIYIGGQTNATSLNYGGPGILSNTAWLPGRTASQVANFHLEAAGSTLDFYGLHSPATGTGSTPNQTIAMYAGGKTYNNVIFSKGFNGSEYTGIFEGTGVPRTTKINYLHFKNPLNVTSNAFIGASTYEPDSIEIGTLISDITTLNIYANGGHYDTAVFNGAANIHGNNKYSDYVYFSPGRTYRFGAGKVQWFSNTSEVSMIGGSGDNLSLYSLTTSSPAYFRKDSLYMCTDFCYMRDIHALGNGNDAPNSCTSYGVSPVNTFNPPVDGNPWLSSISDTITDYNADCGPWYYADLGSYGNGRADFTAGSNADNQGNNAGWNFSPYPTPPAISLGDFFPLNPCQGDSITYDIVIQGDIPVIFGNTIIIDGDTIYNGWISKDPDDMTSGTGLPGDPYIYTDTLVIPAGATSVIITDLFLEVERCFANTATSTDTIFIDVNPTPYDLSAIITPSGVLCAGSNADIDVSSAIATTYSVYDEGPGAGFVGTYPIVSNFNTGSLNDSTTYYIQGVTDEGCKFATQFVVPVGDTIAPLISCPQDTVVYVSNSSCDVTVGNYTIYPSVSVSDNCSTVGNIAITQTPSPETILTADTSIIVWLYAEDEAGNKDSCYFSLTILDTVAPTIVCNASLSVNVNSSCEYVVPSILAEYSALSDNCTTTSSIVLEQSIASGTDTSGVVVVWLTATDEHGNSDSCSVTLNPVDNIPPVITGCPSTGLTANTSDSTCTALVTVPAITAADNCSTPVLAWSLMGATSGNGTGSIGTQAFNLGVTTVTYVAAAGGLTDTCSFTVTVSDSTAPVISCPSNILANTSDSTCTALVTVPAAIATDNCSTPVVTWSLMGTTSGNGTGSVGTQIFNLGATTVTYVATAGGLTDTCSFTVTVSDSTAPVISCPSNILANTSDSTCTVLVTVPAAIATDNCSTPVVTWSLMGATSGNGTGSVGTQIFNLGVTTVTYVATAGGLTDTCTFMVTVSDNTAPTLSCSADTTVNPSATNCAAEVSLADLVTDDNCSVESLTWTMSGATTATSPATGINNIGMYSFNSGVTTIEYTVTDPSGNDALCSFTVTVTDTESPAIEGCPSDTTLANDLGLCGAVVTWNITATDNCGTPTIVSSHNSGDVFPVGTTSVSIIVTDGAGNESTCNFTVTVTDEESPVITDLPTPSQTAFCETEPVTWIAPIVTDNCGVVSFTSSHQSGGNFTVGSTTVIYTAVDAAGNITQDSFVVVVNALPEVIVSTSSVEGCTSDAITLEVENPNASYSYEWEFNGSVVSTSSSYLISSVANADAGTYFVTATNEFACIAEAEVVLTVKSCDIEIFESFSPNGDGKNEFFYVEGLENFPNTRVIIYNRWGAEVYQSNDYQNDWDGRSQSKYNVGGDVLPEASYFYLLELGGDPSDETYGKMYKGYVYLKR